MTQNQTPPDADFATINQAAVAAVKASDKDAAEAAPSDVVMPTDRETERTLNQIHTRNAVAASSVISDLEDSFRINGEDSLKGQAGKPLSLFARFANAISSFFAPLTKVLQKLFGSTAAVANQETKAITAVDIDVVRTITTDNKEASKNDGKSI
jgi:hypothetical protein